MVVHGCMLSHVQLFVTPWTVACQAPLPRDFPGKDTAVGYHFLLRVFLTQRSNPHLLHWQAESLPLSHLGSPVSDRAGFKCKVIWPSNSFLFALSLLSESPHSLALKAFTVLPQPALPAWPWKFPRQSKSVMEDPAFTGLIWEAQRVWRGKRQFRSLEEVKNAHLMEIASIKVIDVCWSVLNVQRKGEWVSRGGQEMEPSRRARFWQKKALHLRLGFTTKCVPSLQAPLYTRWSCLHTPTYAGSFFLLPPHSPGYKVLDGRNLVFFFFFFWWHHVACGISVPWPLKVCMHVLSRVQFFCDPWTVARQAPLSTRFSRQEYWSRLPCPPPGDLP